MAIEPLEQHVSIESEQALIGWLCMSTRHTAKASGLLSPSDFSRPVHGVIFQAAVGLFSNGAFENDDPDPFLILDEVRRLGEDEEEWGGFRYISECIIRASEVPNPARHIAIIKEKSALRKKASLIYDIRERLSKPDAEPDVIAAWANERFAEIGRTASTDLVKVDSVLMSHYEWLCANAKKTGLEGYSTGFSHLDNVTGGYGQPIFALLKGMRKRGKTHHLIAPTYNCLQAGKAALLVSMDTPRSIMLNRFLAYLTGINSFKLKRLSNDSDWELVSEAQAWLWQKPLYFAERSGQTVREIESKCEAIVQGGHELGLVAIDYAELIGCDDKVGSREQELTRIAVGLQNLRDKYQTTVFLLSQINKEGVARWSAGLENACDLIIGWEVTDYENGRGNGNLRTEGNRLGGDCFVECEFDFATSRIRELSLDESEPTYPASWPWWYDDEAPAVKRSAAVEYTAYGNGALPERDQ